VNRATAYTILFVSAVYVLQLTRPLSFPRRQEVERSNVTRMSSLQTEKHIYQATDGGVLEVPEQREKMLDNFMAAKMVELRVGAQVMLIKNVDELLVNGSMGTVKRFVDPAAHVAEGDGAKDESGAPKKKAAPGVVWPLVQFSTPKGVVELMVEPATWKVELPNGEVQVSRTQLPLILSWAMSIHKSQGQTLERVKVDLGKIFEKGACRGRWCRLMLMMYGPGQAYVALSRATSLEGLQVLNFDPSKVGLHACAAKLTLTLGQQVNAHPKVVAWSKTLEELQT
jgi:ATP-dependent DNA helicase PIF1